MGTTPTTTDNAAVRHIVYTGLSDAPNADLFDQRQYNLASATTETSESLLPGTRLACPKTGQINVLADTVRIVAHPTETTTPVLLIGNNATSESTGSASHGAMDISVPLRFNVILNEVPADAVFATATTGLIAGRELELARSVSTTSWAGILVTACVDTGSGPILNGAYIVNKGRMTNRSTITVGIGAND
jgi:hypothetical protein